MFFTRLLGFFCYFQFFVIVFIFISWIPLSVLSSDFYVFRLLVCFSINNVSFFSLCDISCSLRRVEKFSQISLICVMLHCAHLSLYKPLRLFLSIVSILVLFIWVYSGKSFMIPVLMLVLFEYFHEFVGSRSIIRYTSQVFVLLICVIFILFWFYSILSTVLASSVVLAVLLFSWLHCLSIHCWLVNQIVALLQ